MAKSRRGGKIGAGGKPTTYITQSEIDNMNELQFLQLMRHSKVANIELVSEKEMKKREASATKYKNVSQTVDYIKEQVGLDVSKYHNDAAKQFEKRGQYTIDISDMDKDERNRLATALNQKYSPYTGRQTGTWIFTITKKK